MSDVNEANRRRGRSVREGCVLAKTREVYDKKVAQLRLWLVDNYPDQTVVGFRGVPGARGIVLV